MYHGSRLNPTQADGENTLHENPNHYFSVLSNYWFQVIEYVSVTLCSAILSLSTQLIIQGKKQITTSVSMSVKYLKNLFTNI